jgi:hypothetical protein
MVFRHHAIWVGDQVDNVYEEALAISVEPMK